MSKTVSTYYASDSEAMTEAGAAERDYHVLGIISDEKAFLSLVKSFDVLCGYSNTPTRADAVLHDKTRSHYFDTIIVLCRESKLNVKELAAVVEKATGTIATGGRFTRPVAAANLVNFLMKWCRYPSFEPAWHMKKRGGEIPLPASKDKDLWGYLLGIYTEPTKVRLREPDYVKRLAPMYPGYEECLKRARRAATEEMKRRFGNDVDLSPVTDLPRYDDAYTSSFIDMLRRGDATLFGN